MTIVRRLERCLAFVGGLFIVYHAGFRLDQLTSGSMQPALMGRSLTDGDVVLSERVTGRWRQPGRFDIVSFRNEEGLQLMKRVVGLPGESIRLDGAGRVLVNDRALSDRAHPSPRYYPYGNLAAGHPTSCGTGYYVLGDDSVDSQDSRFEGPIEPGRVSGRAWLIVWPLRRVGLVR
jgi:signal peptidase I